MRGERYHMETHKDLFEWNDYDTCRAQPLKRIAARVYPFPAQDREARVRAMADRHIPEWDPEWGGPKPYSDDESRRKLGLREISPPPWYKRIARFYNENWEYMFEGVGPALIVIAMVSMGLLIFVNLGRATGWWGGAW